MKNLNNRYILLLIFSTLAFNSFGQIYTRITGVGSGYQESITITPQGIKSRFPATGEVSNVATGEQALRSVTVGTQNTAIGQSSLWLNSASQNTSFGGSSLTYNTTGTLNAAFGNSALYINSTGNENTSFGNFSLFNNTSLSKNVAVGYYALRLQNYDGDNDAENTAIGHSALYNNNPSNDVNGRQNTAIGHSALYSNTTAAKNTALGYRAIYLNQTGDENIALGIEALSSNVSGSKNIAVGYKALKNNTGSGNVAIGYKAGFNETGSNKLYISYDDESDNTPLIGGDFTAKKVAINRNMLLSGANDFNTRTEALQVGGEAYKTAGNGSWQFVSDSRLKKNIVNLNSQEMLQKVLMLQGVNYEMKDESQKGIQYGFIAQDLREVFLTKIKENSTGYLSADYGSYDPMMVEAIKALNQKIENLRKNKSILDAQNTQLNLDIDELSIRMDKITNIELNKNTSK